jgi:hypothetical protein
VHAALDDNVAPVVRKVRVKGAQVRHRRMDVAVNTASLDEGHEWVCFRILSDEKRSAAGALRPNQSGARCNQLSLTKSLTRRNSAVLFVTIVQPSAIACAAINRSLPPIGLPLRSSRVRIKP